MGEHVYDHSSMSPSMPPAQPRGSSRHHTTSSSRTTTTRPAIRIIHIIAPEIIKTDAANFRSLVQRLTGRQHQQLSDDESSAAVTVAVAPTPPSPIEKPQKKRLAPAPVIADDFVLQQENRGRKKIKCEVVKVEEGGFSFGGGAGAGDLDFGELWMDRNPGGFLSFLEEDVFQGTMVPDFLQPPLGSSRMDLIGEMCASYLA
ncbi:uncharacterized protein LOC124683949 [Lolium rigidum]|uniref:uncharacterized protein LOC124683949 n=1 Tax=Lolium rigidum TaxID=89674 RepID=UPI001F5C829F|nr:uncharacterized protein LOC124683949 [Lolium rigidum]